MGQNTEIAWTDHSFNPWWGCERVSPGCDNCYAETFSKRTGHDVWGHNAPHRFFGDKHWDEPLKWERQASEAGVPAKVFCASMADVFQLADDVVDARARLWDLIDATPNLIWQLLTKRPENVMRFVPQPWIEGDWPENVWLGTTAEDQIRANLRVPRLLAVPGVDVRFLSCEPLIGSVYLGMWLDKEYLADTPYFGAVNWIICGGESGPHHRPMNLDHARALRDECGAYDVPFFFKQVGGRTPKSGGDLLDGEEHKFFPR